MSEEFTWNCGVEVIDDGFAPHRGSRGTVMPFEHRIGGVMLFVQYDAPAEDGETAGYHFPGELRRLASAEHPTPRDTGGED